MPGGVESYKIVEQPQWTFFWWEKYSSSIYNDLSLERLNFTFNPRCFCTAEYILHIDREEVVLFV